MAFHRSLAVLLASMSIVRYGAQAQKVEQVDPVQKLRDDGIVVARAAGAYPSAKVVEYVARNAKPMTVVQPGDRSLESLTGHQVIERACGSVQPGYETLVVEANPSRKVNFDVRLGTEADRIVWPACLYATISSPLQSFTAAEGDSQTELAQRFTGFGKFIPNRLKELFGAVGKLQAGERVSLSVLTAPTFLKPLNDLKTFNSGLSNLGDVVSESPKEGGAIIGPTEESCNGLALVPVPSEESPGILVPSSWGDVRNVYPFAATVVVAAYRWTLGHRMPVRTNVAVVDNGFWGVPCATDDCPGHDLNGAIEFAEPFPKAFFPTEDYNGDIGPKLANEIAPINYLNGLVAGPVDAVSGHGTHVTGLIAGGPLLYPAGRAIFGPSGDSWLKIVVGNIAPGGLTFAKDADERLFLILSKAALASELQVVNLSLALSESRSIFIKGVVRSPSWAGTLFVAAAGNDKKPLEEVREYPALMGGVISSNLVTVASVDSDGTLSHFSNYSVDSVDLAAPGCKIKSWLTLEDAPQAVSGTSQAAPLVTFAAAAMHSLWPNATPTQLKNRLGYSGALLKAAGDREKLVSAARLDIVQALLLRDDVVVARNPDRVLLGRVSKIEGLTCLAGSSPTWDNVKSFKQNDGTRLYSTVGGSARNCEAKLAENLGGNPNIIYVNVRGVFDSGDFNVASGTIKFPAADLVEFVRAELPY